MINPLGIAAPIAHNLMSRLCDYLFTRQGDTFAFAVRSTLDSIVIYVKPRLHDSIFVMEPAILNRRGFI